MGDGRCSLQAWLSFLGYSCQQLLYLCDGSARVETLGAGLGAVHDGVASEFQNDDIMDGFMITFISGTLMKPISMGWKA